MHVWVNGMYLLGERLSVCWIFLPTLPEKNTGVPLLVKHVALGEECVFLLNGHTWDAVTHAWGGTTHAWGGTTLHGGNSDMHRRLSGRRTGAM